MLSMVSQAMGSYLSLVGPDGTRIASSGVKSPGQSAVILEQLSETGSYTIIANAASPDQSGSYQIKATQPLLVERGMLHKSTAPCLESGQRCQTYRFLGKANQTISLLLHQSEFSPYIVLLDPSGKTVAGGPTETQAAINFSLLEDGWYTLIIATQEPEATGSFSISVHDKDALTPVAEVAQQ